MHILTFDIEEWYIEKVYHGGRYERYKIFEKYLSRILDLLEKEKIKGTFFCLGRMAIDFPNIVKKIAEHGHEIGCHSHRHTWMNKLKEAEAREDTHAAVDALEQCIGQKVLCYRAPAFSIGVNNKWMIEILAENGITRDASIYPAARDFGGFPQFGTKTPCYVEYKGIRLKEFPICTTTLLGKELAYSGGGYFRFFPLSFVKDRMEKGNYTMCYFHIDDLTPDVGGVKSREEYEAYYKEPGTLKNRYLRYIKANIGKKGAFEKMCKLIVSKEFVNLEQADVMIDWNIVTTIEL